MNLDKSQMNILDWGCGRDRAIAWLRQQGYNAFGVDIDPEPINNCKDLLRQRGYDPEAVLSLLENGKETKFPDNYFHFSFSNGVFEHVQDLESVAENLKRLTTSGGVGSHFFPAHKHFVEIHLRLPFVHWLPKNILCKIYIFLFVLFGKGPKWKELQAKRPLQKANGYYNYITHKTYYRSCRTIETIFKQNNFKVAFIPLHKFGLKKHPLLDKLVRFKLLHPFLNWCMNNFGQVGLIITREAD
ncbi:hypothetical protein ES703_19151 [subsurface metagenome]